MTRKLQGRLGQPGAELRSTFESLSIHGVCRENNWPFFVHKSEKEPSFGAIAEALEFKVTSFEYVNPKNFNTMIDLKIPISIGLQTGRMFWKLHGPISTQEYKPVNLVDNRGSRGHAVTVIGYDNSICGGAWIIANSIGPKWGDKGYGILPYECYRDIGEAYCITGFADLPPSEKNFNN
jgi:C1A family cysteine protease